MVTYSAYQNWKLVLRILKLIVLKKLGRLDDDDMREHVDDIQGQVDKR